MCTEQQLKNLLCEPESEYLDFKQRFPENNINLIHDILCMANADSKKERYLIYGVTDSGSVVGIENDSQKKTQANIFDCLRQSHINRIPSIKLKEFLIQDHAVAFLIIKDKPEKPYFLTKDKSSQGKTIRAGVIYSRLGDTNIPLMESTSESRIEGMWRERFGLNLSPHERLHRYLDEPENWQNRDAHNFYYKPFPEFQLISSENSEPFTEDWTDKFSDKEAYRLTIEARYHLTVLDEYSIIACDGYRSHLPLPKPHMIGDIRKWRISRNCNIYKISKLFLQHQDLDETLTRIGIEVLDEG